MITDDLELPINRPIKSDLTPMDVRDKVFAIEAKMKQMPQLDLAVLHHFSDGIYGRELIILKDTIIVGKIHKYRSLNILMKGELSVLIDGDIRRIKAPIITVAPPGMKRIAYAHEDSIWLTVHGTNETDLAKIEDHFIAQSETEWLEFCKREPMLPLEDTEYKRQAALINNTSIFNVISDDNKFDLKALQELRKSGQY